MRTALLLLVLAACARAPAATNDAALVVAPPPPSASAPVVAPTASSAAPPVAPPRELAIVGGDLVDLETLAQLHTLTKDGVFVSAFGIDVAYAYAGTPGSGPNELYAYEIGSGAVRWSKPATCTALAASRLGVFCTGSSGAFWFDARTGDARTLRAGRSAPGVLTLGARTLVVYDDARLEAFDESGAPLGAITVPVNPDGGYSRNVLSRAGDLACGTQRSDAATEAFCVDTSPRVVWRRRIAVPRGALVQSDEGALVIASDTWGKPIASEVVNPRDGAALLHLDAVRLGAALTTNGVLEGALTSDPEVVFHDAKGAVRWKWRPASVHRDAIRAVRAGSKIAVALYSPIATGTLLYALDANTGALAWTGNVEQLPISHSKYSNEVALRLGKTGILLSGHESSQDYRQLFDPDTGARTASVLRPRFGH